ncbi:type I restriction-modification system subunit M [Myxococcota bacterium]|nr:type I restriction-modification system subunit M [Myxococcota bacterium]
MAARKTAPAGPKTKRQESKETATLDLLPLSGGKLSREQLERYLWSAADILRGSIDSSDYKNFIFGLLFLKRLSDRFEEECEELRKEGADPEDPDEHQFFVPKPARWSEIQKTATGLGEVVNKASAALEEANTTLEGVLAGIDYNDERKLGDAKQRDNILNQLVQHFAGLNLRNDHLSEPDMLGRAYEYLIEKFADDAGKKGGEFYTPNMVVKLIVELLEPKEGMRICDPTCGSGGMLIQSAKYITEHGGQAKNFSLFGQEKNLGTWAICKMNMLLHGFPDARIEKGDTIRDPKLLQDGELMLFDRVIANPPFSLDAWGSEVAENDPHGRFRFGIPPKTKGDLAFFQHMVATLNVHGKMGIVMPHGVLFRGSSEGRIRQGLIEADLIETVVGLPSNLFYGAAIPATILIVNRDKPKEHKGKVLFVEASREYREGSAQNYLRDEDVSKIAATIHAFKDVERYARIVPVEEIEKNDFNLNISRYVETAEHEERVDVASAVAKLREAETARDKAKAAMDRFLAELGYDA